MMTMAVITSGDIRGHVGFAERHCFAVISVTIMLEPIFVATAAFLVTCHFEVTVLRRFHLVGRMAVGADGAAFVAFGEQLSVNTLIVGLFDLHMTLAAGLGDVRLVDR